MKITTQNIQGRLLDDWEYIRFFVTQSAVHSFDKLSYMTIKRRMKTVQQRKVLQCWIQKFPVALPHFAYNKVF